MKSVGEHRSFVLGCLAGICTLFPYTYIASTALPLTALLVSSAAVGWVLFPVAWARYYCNRYAFVTGVLMMSCACYVRLDLDGPWSITDLYLATESYPKALWIGFIAHTLHTVIYQHTPRRR